MKYRFLSLTLAAMALSACTGPIIMGTDAAIIYTTKPNEPPPADPNLQVPPHESWCYSTMGDTECYSKPQDVPPSRLVMVDPPSHYPIDLPSYEERLHPAATHYASEPPVLISQSPAAANEVVQQKLQPVIVPAPQPVVKPVAKKKHKKKHKKAAVTTAPAIAAPPVVAQ